MAGVQVRLFASADLGRSLLATADESGYFALPLTAMRQVSPLPARMQLGQNYPNPPSWQSQPAPRPAGPESPILPIRTETLRGDRLATQGGSTRGDFDTRNPPH